MNLTEVPTKELIAELQRRQKEASEAIANMRTSKRTRAAVAAVIQAVCKEWRISVEDLFSPGRPKRVTDPRQAAMHLMREHLFMAFERVGAVFGKDHGTVIHACNTHEGRMTDPKFSRRYKAALHAIKKHSLEAAGFEFSIN